MRRIQTALLAMAALVVTSVCSAGDNTFLMTAIFSDQAGLFQYIQFQESSGQDNQHLLKDRTLTVTSRSGVVKSVTFPNDLPLSQTAGRFMLVGTTYGPPVDFELPPGFLPTDGGTLDFAGSNYWEYGVLPANGYTVLRRDGSLSTNLAYITGIIARSFAGFPTGLLVAVDPVIEYYNKALDHYFMSSSQPDIDALDSGRIPGWQRTGESFPAWIARADYGVLGLMEVCRLHIPPAVGDSHFFSASAVECADARAKHPEYLLETSKAFYASLPNSVSGACTYDQIPIYRLWNARVDSNHRYTASPAIRDLMRSKGYIAEGYGPNAVAMCAGGYVGE